MKKYFLRKNNEKINIFLKLFFLFVITFFVQLKTGEAALCDQLTNGVPGGVNECVLPGVDNPSQTIKGEVSSIFAKTGERGNYCAKFRLGISGHHDIVVLEKNEVDLAKDSDLMKCREVGRSLEKAYADGLVNPVPSSGVLQPFREKYYYEREYPEKMVIPDQNFTFFHDLNTDDNWKYDKNYYDYFYNDYPNNPGGAPAIGNFCRIHLELGTNKLLFFETRYRPSATENGYVPGMNQEISKCIETPATWTCNHKNVYTYGLRYDITQDGKTMPISITEPHKCEEIKMAFSPSSEWFQSMTMTSEDVTKMNIDVVPFSHDMFVSPPTNILNCADQASCLNLATKQILEGTTFGKGAQKVASDFVENAQKSINAGSDNNIKCLDGKCTAYLSGNHNFNSTIPVSSYFGQCGNDFTTVDLPEAAIPSVKNTSIINIINRPPLISVSMSQEDNNLGDEAVAICDVIDPDTCSDKISKIKWYCFNDKNQKVNCYFKKDGGWEEGTMTEEFSEEKQSSQCRSEVKFKADVEGVYAVVCEGSDNDSNSMSSGRGLKAAKFGNCGQNGICNKNCTEPDPDCAGVLAEKFKFCSVLFGNGSTNTTICGNSAEANLSVFKSETIEDANISKYAWDCGNGEGIKETLGSSLKCLFGKEGSYVPKLKIYYKNGDEPTECSTENSLVKVASSAKCSVLARPLGSSGEYLKSLKIGAGQSIEAKIDRECTKDETTVWSTDGNKLGVTTNNKVTVKYQSGGIGYIKAKIGATECEGANITIEEAMKWGQ